MWDDEDGIVTYELTEEECDLLENTFANEACLWVAYEVRKALGDRVKQWRDYPGAKFRLFEPKSRPEAGMIVVGISPVSERLVSVDCLLWDKEQTVTPEEAVQLILNL